MELPADSLAKALRAVTGGGLPRLLFQRKDTLSKVWETAQLPSFRKLGTRRLLLISIWSLAIFGIVVIVCRFGSHGQPASGIIETRTWWYATQDGSGSVQGTSATAGFGLVDWFYFARGAPLTSARSILQRSIPESRVFLKDCFGGIQEAAKLGLLTATVVTVLCWCGFLGLESAVGLKRTYWVGALLSGLLYPFLITGTALIVAKLGYVFWWWGELPVYVLSVANLVAIASIPLGMARMALACPVARWRVVMCVLLVGLCSLAMLPVVGVVVSGFLWVWF